MMPLMAAMLSLALVVGVFDRVIKMIRGVI